MMHVITTLNLRIPALLLLVCIGGVSSSSAYGSQLMTANPSDGLEQVLGIPIKNQWHYQVSSSERNLIVQNCLFGIPADLRERMKSVTIDADYTSFVFTLMGVSDKIYGLDKNTFSDLPDFMNTVFRSDQMVSHFIQIYKKYIGGVVNSQDPSIMLTQARSLLDFSSLAGSGTIHYRFYEYLQKNMINIINDFGYKRFASTDGVQITIVPNAPAPSLIKM